MLLSYLAILLLYGTSMAVHGVEVSINGTQKQLVEKWHEYEKLGPDGYDSPTLYLFTEVHEKVSDD